MPGEAVTPPHQDVATLDHGVNITCDCARTSWGRGRSASPGRGHAGVMFQFNVRASAHILVTRSLRVARMLASFSTLCSTLADTV